MVSNPKYYIFYPVYERFLREDGLRGTVPYDSVHRKEKKERKKHYIL